MDLIVCWRCWLEAFTNRCRFPFSDLQVLSMSKDDYRNASFITSGSFDQDFPIPELIGPTEILSEDHRLV